MKITKKIFAGFIFTLIFAASSHAAKWQTLVFTEDLNLGFIELERYCMLHDLTVSDVLWANSIDKSADIKAGTSIYLPANQADMLSIWQNNGAWKPTALVPMNSAAAAKKIAAEHEKKVEAKKEKENAPIAPYASGHVTPMEKEVITPQESAELQAKLKEIMTESSQPEIIKETQKIITAEAKPEIKTEYKSETAKINPKFPDIITDMKIDKTESPQAAIAKMAKGEVILPEKTKKTAQAHANDPVIVLSPNGEMSQAPMRLLIVGDKVEVVRAPENAVPKTPSVADLDHVFGTDPGYLYDFNSLPKTNNYTINLRNLGGKMMWPVDGKVSSYFGLRGSRKHEGIDIPMPEGTPIRAARNGIVTKTGDNSTMGFRGYGNFIMLEHGGNLKTFYAHCSRVAVKEGQRIMQGQIIGYVGSTGRSTANHLHFEVRLHDTKVDPIPYLGGRAQLASNNKKK